MDVRTDGRTDRRTDGREIVTVQRFVTKVIIDNRLVSIPEELGRLRLMWTERISSVIIILTDRHASSTVLVLILEPFTSLDRFLLLV